MQQIAIEAGEPAFEKIFNIRFNICHALLCFGQKNLRFVIIFIICCVLLQLISSRAKVADDGYDIKGIVHM